VYILDIHDPYAKLVLTKDCSCWYPFSA